MTSVNALNLQTSIWKGLRWHCRKGGSKASHYIIEARSAAHRTVCCRCAHRSRAAVGASNAKSQPGDAQGHSAWSIEDFSEHAKSTTELLKGVNAALAIVNYSHGVNIFDIDSTEAIHQIPKSTTPPLCD